MPSKIHNNIKINYNNINQELLNNIQLPVFYLAIRRIFELLLLILFSPLIILICLVTILLIKCFSPGPIFFIQQRPGVNGTIINVFKFRTMKHLTPNDKNDFQHYEKNVTKLGHFLRKHRIDELPQIINIFKGEMSLIGPRPEPLHYYQQCVNQFPLYKYKFLIKPGITGWAQVWFKHTDNVSEAIQKFEYDVYYLMNLSFKTDLIIFIKTFSVILFGIGAR